MHFDVRRAATSALAIALSLTTPTPSTAAEREVDFRELRAIDAGHHAYVPELIGIVVLTDGEETHSASSADFGSFVLRQDPS
jgi:hypothetical protein